MSDSEFVFFNFASGNTLKDEKRVSRLMYQIVERAHFRFKKDPLDDQFIENTVQSLENAWNQAVQGGPPAYVFLFNSEGLELSLGIFWENFKQMFIEIDNGYISDLLPFNYESVRSFVQVCELVYQVLQPDYGFGLVSPSIHGISDSKADISIEAIYDYNFFGPRLVEKLGRERVLSVPTWRTVQYDDGGVFLEMSPSPIADWKPYTSNYRRAAEILGVDKYYQGG